MTGRKHVEREFGGKLTRFEIKRSDVPMFEASTKESAFVTLKRLLAGAWTSSDVETVLSFAIDGPDKTTRLAASMGLPIGVPIKANSAVRSVLHADGYGNYAPLAADVLSAAIFGAGDE